MADYTREPWNDPAKNVIAASKSRMNSTSAVLVMAISPVDSEPLSTGGSVSLNGDLAVSGKSISPIMFINPVTGDPYTL